MVTNIKENVVYFLILLNLTEELLKKGYLYDPKNPTKGFCYVATEAFYHLVGKETGWYPVRGKDEEGVTHWWLENEDESIMDMTFFQYLNEDRVIPYNNGKRGGFLTKLPSKRCQILMEKVSKYIL